MPKQKGTITALVAQDGRPLILEAAIRGQGDAIRQLIATGADIEARDEDGNTPLALAASGGQLSAVDTLLSANAEINARRQPVDARIRKRSRPRRRSPA